VHPGGEREGQGHREEQAASAVATASELVSRIRSAARAGSTSWPSRALRLPPPKRTGLSCSRASPTRSPAGATPSAAGTHCASPILRRTPDAACRTHSFAALAAADTLGARALARQIRKLGGETGIKVAALSVDDEPPGAREPATPGTSIGLTARERQVLELLAMGLTNRRIAKARVHH
jgi:Bacterial regulatory proteins, luxR family